MAEECKKPIKECILHKCKFLFSKRVIGIIIFIFAILLAFVEFKIAFNEGEILDRKLLHLKDNMMIQGYQLNAMHHFLFLIKPDASKNFYEDNVKYHDESIEKRDSYNRGMIAGGHDILEMENRTINWTVWRYILFAVQSLLILINIFLPEDQK